MPGKFEGEPRYAEYYYGEAMEGGADEIYIDEYDTQIDVFEITRADKTEYPELGNYEYLLLWEDDNGFVYTEIFVNWESADSWLTERGVFN